MSAANDSRNRTFNSLSTTQKSVFLLERILEGAQEKDLMRLWDDDEAQGRGYLLFLKEMEWIRDGDAGGSYLVTDAGRAALETHSRRKMLKAP